MRQGPHHGAHRSTSTGTLALSATGTGRIGCGFITWKLDEDASALDWVLHLPPEDRPRALMLSFGDPRPYAARIAQAGCTLICQIQRMDQAPLALEAGADIFFGDEASVRSDYHAGTTWAPKGKSR